MHTFFINTALGLYDIENAPQFLFRNLSRSNKLICFSRRIEDLRSCAYEINDLINKDSDITDEFNIIVFADIKGKAEQAWVQERILSAAVNENLASVLCEKGKKAGNIQLIFGEHFDRKNEFWEGEAAFLPETKKLLWEALGFPPLSEFAGLSEELSAQNPVSQENICMQIKEILSRQRDAEQRVPPLNLGGGFSDMLADTFSEAAAEKIKKNIKPEITDILSDAFVFINEQRSRLFSVNPVSSVWLSFSQSDEFMLNRDIYRMYLYVYYCAVFETAGSKVPEVRWDEFASCLAERKDAFENENRHLQDIKISFPFLDIAALGGGDMQAADDDSDIWRIEYELPEFRTDFEVRPSVSRRRLKAEADTILSDVKTKNERIRDELEEFAVQITGNFNEGRSRDFAEKMRSFRKTDKMIKAVPLSKRTALKWKSESDSTAAGQEELISVNTNFAKKFAEIKKTVDRSFECIKGSRMTAVLFVLVMVLFAVPYYLIQRDDLSHSYSDTMFLISAGAAAAVFAACIFLYVRKFKKLIVYNLKLLRDEFNEMQRSNELNAVKFKKRLTFYIPRSTALHSYYNDLINFEKQDIKLGQLYYYHSRSLNSFVRYAESLLRTLDIEHLAKESQQQGSAARRVLNSETIRKDTASCTDLYFILDRITVRKVFAEEVV